MLQICVSLQGVSLGESAASVLEPGQEQVKVSVVRLRFRGKTSQEKDHVRVNRSDLIVLYKIMGCHLQVGEILDSKVDLLPRIF